MKLNNQELIKEEKYLNNILSLVNESINKKELNIETTIKKISGIEHYVWDSLTDLDPVEIGFMKQEIERNIDLGNFDVLQNLMLHKMQKSPYFGRIDFKTTKDSEEVYIGLSSLMDSKYNIHIYDWRAPISSMFYDYELGSSKYKAPVGEIKGDITLKRQYKIEDGKIIYAFDSAININDEILQEAILNNTNNNHMQNIVTTIQKEQNLIIRNEDNKYLIVEGPAGSGKTSVALHRIAYLLYKHRETLTNKEVLIFSPNSIFSEYISSVLPELGERNAVHTEFTHYIHHFIKEYHGIESYTHFLKRIYQNKNINDSVKIKLDDKYIEVVDRYIDEIIKNIKFNNIYIGKFFIMSTKDQQEIFTNDLKKYPPLVALTRLKEYIMLKYNHQTTRQVNQQRLETIVKRQLPDYLNIRTLMKNMYKNEVMIDYIKKAYKVNDNFFKIVIKELNNKKLTYENSIIFTYFKGKLHGFGEDKSIKYIIIDEAQDYNKMQLMILKSIFKNAHFTILGDSNQAINPLFNYRTLDDLKTIFEKALTLTLKTSYRNTYEITEYCNKILNLNNINSINRHGAKPKVYQETKDIKKILNENIPYKSTAIIVKTIEEVDPLIAELKQQNIIVAKYNNRTVNDKTFVIPVFYAKGLEFDAVIVINKEIEDKILYVACSRALHKLDIVNI